MNSSLLELVNPLFLSESPKVIDSYKSRKCQEIERELASPDLNHNKILNIVIAAGPTDLIAYTLNLIPINHVTSDLIGHIQELLGTMLRLELMNKETLEKNLQALAVLRSNHLANVKAIARQNFLNLNTKLN